MVIDFAGMTSPCWRNDAKRNSDDRIDVDDPTTTLTLNRTTRNADLGIEAVPGVTVGYGNSASLNGNPVRCLTVACN